MWGPVSLLVALLIRSICSLGQKVTGRPWGWVRLWCVFLLTVACATQSWWAQIRSASLGSSQRGCVAWPHPGLGDKLILRLGGGCGVTGGSLSHLLPFIFCSLIRLPLRVFFSFLIIFMCVSGYMYVCAPHMCLVSMEARRGCWIT